MTSEDRCAWASGCQPWSHCLILDINLKQKRSLCIHTRCIVSSLRIPSSVAGVSLIPFNSERIQGHRDSHFFISTSSLVCPLFFFNLYIYQMVGNKGNLNPVYTNVQIAIFRLELQNIDM